MKGKENMLLDGKSVFLTGASGGIGRPLATLLRAHGAQVSTYDRAQQGDLMENIDTTCKALCEKTPDILINLAGVNAFDLAENQNYDALLTLNLLVPMRLCQAVLPAMRARDYGQIVNVGSMVGLIPLPHMTGYSAAKSGLKGFSDALRRELANTGVRVSHIAPRAVHTSMNSGKLGLLNKRTHTPEDRPRDVANRIISAIERNEADVRIGWPERLFAQLNAIFPSLIDKGLRKNTTIGMDILNADRSVAEPAQLVGPDCDATRGNIA